MTTKWGKQCGNVMPFGGRKTIAHGDAFAKFVDGTVWLIGLADDHGLATTNFQKNLFVISNVAELKGEWQVLLNVRYAKACWNMCVIPNG